MILVTGSLAYDYIMTYGEVFEDKLIPSAMSNLSVSFFIDSMRKHRGGTAGNIAYNLKLLGESPILMATVGYDFDQYKEALDLEGINDSYITVLEDESTATGFSTTDSKGNQIWMFHPGAMDKAVKNDITPLVDKVKYAIIAPEIHTTMMHYVKECKKHGLPYIFDPGQNIHTFDKDELISGITGAMVVIMNEYEWQLFHSITGLNKDDVTKKAEYLIVTLAEKGSEIYSNGDTYQVERVSAHEVHDPTGCGDAYRAGLLKGLNQGLSVHEAAKIASLAATYCVEEHGTQTHRFTLKEFETRLQEVE